MADEEIAAVDTGAGDGTGVDGAEGQGDQQLQDGQDGRVAEGAVGPDGQPLGAEGDPNLGEPGADGQGGGGGRANETIRELRARTQAAEQRFDDFVRKFGGEGGERNGREPFKPDERYSRFHDAMGGYVDSHFRHMAEPLAAAVIEQRQQYADLTDRLDFYADHPEFAQREQRGQIEKARSALSQQTGQPWSRLDTVRYLRGHEKFASRFQTTADRDGALDQRLVGARRIAGRIPQPSGRARPGGEPDLSAMTPEQRVAHIEKTHGSAAI